MKNGWYSQHTEDEADRIRILTAQLHNKPFTYRLNEYIRGLTEGERLDALQGDKEARRKLGPKQVHRPSGKSKSTKGVVKTLPSQRRA
jgi:hypothetical protein